METEEKMKTIYVDSSEPGLSYIDPDRSHDPRISKSAALIKRGQDDRRRMRRYMRIRWGKTAAKDIR